MRRALLIGSQTYGLEGVSHDLALMKRTLKRLRFATSICCGVQASRGGILAAWRDLIAATQPEDAVILYYAGHGGRAPNPDWRAGSSQARYLQFIVPTDIAESRADDFRGILNHELAHLLADLTAICRNVTLLLDCCHAARLTRSSRARARALPHTWEGPIAEHLAKLKASGKAASPHLEGNPHVVCLAAAGASQSAYEDPSGALGGYFTEILAEALDQVGEQPVPWEIIGRWVREQVLVMEPRQRPELQGPTHRHLFDTNPTPAQVGALTFFYDEAHGGKPSMRGGHLHGVAKGNTYAVLKLDQLSPEQQRRVATAKVTEVLGSISRLEISGGEPCDGAPMSALRENLPKRQVAVAANVPASLRKLIESSRLFELAPPGARATMANLETTGSGLLLRDGSGKVRNAPTHDEGSILQLLHHLARALTLRELAQVGPGELDQAFELSWGRVSDGIPNPLPSTATINEGERIYVSMENRSGKPLFVNLFDIGLSSRITLLNDSARSGYELAPEETWCFGHQSGVGLIGVAPSWPKDLPTDEPRLESIIAIISEEPMDLTVLEGKGSPQRGASPRSRLERAVAARCLGESRSAPNAAEPDVRYAIRHIDFELIPMRKGPISYLTRRVCADRAQG